MPLLTPAGKDVYRVGANGAGLCRLTRGNGYVEFRLSAQDRHGSTDGPHLSPEGKQLAYIAVKDGVPNVCVMNADGSGQRQVTYRKTPCGRVRWSPDGKSLAFVSFDGKYPSCSSWRWAEVRPGNSRGSWARCTSSTGSRDRFRRRGSAKDPVVGRWRRRA